MGNHRSGRKEIEYDYSGLGTKLFLRADEFILKTGMKYSTLCNKIYRKKILSLKTSNHHLLLNPCADFDAYFDALPALLSCRQVCDFFGEKKISNKMMNDIGFFHVSDEDEPHTDKLSLAHYLERRLLD